MASNYGVCRFLHSAITLAMLAAIAARVDTRAQSREADTPAVAIVARSGLMLPLAAFVGGSWVYLPWPSRELGAPLEEFPLPVRRSLADIPPAWFKPLSTMPRAWRYQPIGGSMRDVTIGVPMRREGVLTESVGLTVRPWNYHGNDTDDAGIAVAGNATPLTVRHLHGSSREWRGIVHALAPRFLAAERRWTMRNRRIRVPSLATLTRQLLAADVSLHEIAAGPDMSYWYFETAVPRAAGRESRAAGCRNILAMHQGLLERRRSDASFHVRWIRGGDMGCGGLTEGGSVVGAVIVERQMRVVMKWGGDDWADYRLVDPAGPDRRFAPGPDAGGAFLDPRTSNFVAFRPASASRAAGPATSGAWIP